MDYLCNLRTPACLLKKNAMKVRLAFSTFHRIAIFLLLIVGWPFPAHAGMTVYDLTDVARLRLEDISFFLVLLLLATFGIRFLWNVFARDFPRLPRGSLPERDCARIAPQSSCRRRGADVGFLRRATSRRARTARGFCSS